MKSNNLLTTEGTEITENGLREPSDALIEFVIGAAMRVHRELGPGLLESVYEKALSMELLEHGVSTHSQVEVPAFYRGNPLGLGFRADMIVSDCLLLEIKATEGLGDVHMAQVITYLRLLKFKRGLILNFNERLLKNGIRRVSI